MQIVVGLIHDIVDLSGQVVKPLMSELKPSSSLSFFPYGANRYGLPFRQRLAWWYASEPNNAFLANQETQVETDDECMHPDANNGF